MGVGEICSRDVVFARRNESVAQAARLMPAEVVCVRDTDGLGRAVALMRAQGVRRLPVIDASGAR